jgi:RNA polymerase sigma-70 factor (ECF subfamily)
MVAGTTALETRADPVELEERFRALVESHRDRAIRLAWRLVDGDAAAAEDVVQDAFVRAYRSLGGFRGEASLSTWFYRIVVREAQHHRRWRAVRMRWNAVWKGEPVRSESAPSSDPGLRQRIRQALSGLTGSQREAFVLVHLEGFTVRETAALLGKPDGTIKSHLHRALRALRVELADLREREEDRGT